MISITEDKTLNVRVIRIGNAVYKAGPDGRIYWANPEGWRSVGERVKEGTFREVCYGPSTYNHSSFFLVR